MASNVGKVAVELAMHATIKRLGLALLCVCGLTACDRNGATSAMSATGAPSRSLPSTASSVSHDQEAPLVIDDASMNNSPPLLPSPVQTASIITNRAALSDYQYAYMAIIQIMSQDLGTAMYANNPDVLFAQGMIAHHQAAINLAKIQLEYGQDAKLRKLAEDIMAAQQNEVQLMQNWLATNPDTPKPTAQTPIMQQEFNNGMSDMHEQMMAGVMVKAPDVAFAQTILPHHKGALALAQVEIKYGNDDKMRQLADSIIETQQDEIQVIQYWLAEHAKS